MSSEWTANYQMLSNQMLAFWLATHVHHCCGFFSLRIALSPGTQTTLLYGTPFCMHSSMLMTSLPSRSPAENNISRVMVRKKQSSHIIWEISRDCFLYNIDNKTPDNDQRLQFAFRGTCLLCRYMVLRKHKAYILSAFQAKSNCFISHDEWCFRC